MKTSPFIPAENGLVFDIGANTGYVAATFLEHGAQQVIAVEPCFKNFVELRKQPGVTAIQAAVWDEPGFIKVSFCSNESGWSSCRPDKWQQAYPQAQWDPAQWIPAITLKQMIAAFGLPDLLKVDVEGCEWEVFGGLSANVPTIMFEFHHKFISDAVKILEHLQVRGYQRAHYVRENLDLDTVPTTPLAEFTKRWLDDQPEWGNITVQ